MKQILFFLCLFTSFTSFANGLKPFETDYCTMFVDGTSSRPTLWRHCCVEHDIHYWYGGSKENQKQADLNLKSCVKEAAGPYWAALIYSGVRAGHYSPIKNAHKWSWGWEENRENQELSEVEKSYILDELRRLPLDPEMIEQYIKNNF